jgi:hypothetical protein
VRFGISYSQANEARKRKFETEGLKALDLLPMMGISGSTLQSQFARASTWWAGCLERLIFYQMVETLGNRTTLSDGDLIVWFSSFLAQAAER